jgi:hypothetical protein
MLLLKLVLHLHSPDHVLFVFNLLKVDLLFLLALQLLYQVAPGLDVVQ